MTKRTKIIAAALAAAGVAIAATVVGYQDWQVRSSAPGLPGTGYFRTWADLSSGLIKCITPTGTNCFFSGSSGLSLETNGTANGSQSLLNLQQGSNIALTDNGSGQITIDAAALSLLLKTNGVTNGSQSILNLAAGSNMTLTDNGSGTVTLDSSGGSLTLQTNGTNNGLQTLLNLAAGGGITLIDNGSGTVTVSTTAGSLRAIGMAFGQTGGSALSSGTTQYVTVPFGCTIKQWDMTVDQGTATVDVWKRATAPNDWAGATGTVNTSGTNVTWVSGGTFPSDAAGTHITINGTLYTIASVTSSTALVLTSSAAIQSAVAYAAPTAGIPTISNSIVASAYPAVSTSTTAGSSALTGWTTAVTKSDVFGFNLKTISGGTTALSVVLECQQ
jgi:hypothetical protein